MRLLPFRVCCHQDGASLAQHSQVFEQAQKNTAPRKIDVTSKSPVGDISVVTLIRTDTTIDHSQKAEKVCSFIPAQAHCMRAAHMPRGAASKQSCCSWHTLEGLQLNLCDGQKEETRSRLASLAKDELELESSPKIGEVTLMRPIHGNL